MQKLDIHMHTTYSDGSDTVAELLKQAQQLGLVLLSITDHNNVDAHVEISTHDYATIFSGKIVKGVEIYSYYKGKVVEFLVYDYDLNKMKAFLDDTYNQSWNKNRIDTVLAKLKAAATKKGVVFDQNFTIETVGECAQFFKHMRARPENEKFFAPSVWSGEKTFFRKEVCDPNSPWYVDYGEFYIKPKQLIKAVHEMEGKIFLAHPFEYKFSQEVNIEFWNLLIEYGMDGIEAYYPKFEKEEIEQILTFAKQNHLKVCGGSDYHGHNRANKLGHITKKIEVDYQNYAWLDQTNNINKEGDEKCISSPIL